MDAVGNIQTLLSQGRFAAAMLSLSNLPLVKSRTLGIETLRLELLERTGNHTDADVLGTRLLRSRALTGSQQSVCEFCLGLIRWDRGQTQAAVAHFQRSVSKAVEDSDLWRTCWGQLRLLVSMSGQSADPATGRLLQDVRKNVVRLGDPMVSAALHIFLGEIEAKRGLLAVACRHTQLGQ